MAINQVPGRPRSSVGEKGRAKASRRRVRPDITPREGGGVDGDRANTATPSDVSPLISPNTSTHSCAKEETDGREPRQNTSEKGTIMRYEGKSSDNERKM